MAPASAEKTSPQTPAEDKLSRVTRWRPKDSSEPAVHTMSMPAATLAPNTYVLPRLLPEEEEAETNERPKEVLIALQSWEGVVLNVDDSSLVVRLIDVTAERPDEEVTLSRDEAPTSIWNSSSPERSCTGPSATAIRSAAPVNESREFAFAVYPPGPRVSWTRHEHARRNSNASLTGSHMELGLPDPEELEISLFGPGYGEALVLHLGEHRWMIVDSCLDTESGRARALAYLEAIGVDYTRDVAFVLATHWHDDHVRGLGEVVEACENSTVPLLLGVSRRGIPYLDEVDVLGAERMTSGVREFARILEILRDRKATGKLHGGPSFVLENAVVDQTTHCEVKALSPSSAAIERAMAGIASMLPEQRRPHLRVAAPSSNEGSVALWMKGNAGTALLAADVERQATDDRGWGAIVALTPAAMGRAGLVKVPTTAQSPVTTSACGMSY